MGLFRKKKATEASNDATDGSDAPLDDSQPGAAPAPAGAQAKQKRAKGSSAEMETMRAEMADLRARLEAAEKAKLVVEHRLSALDATTTTLAGDKATITELAGKVHTLELTVGSTLDPGGSSRNDGDDTPVSIPNLPDLGSKLAGLEARLAEMQAKLDTPPSPLLQPRPLLPATEPTVQERERLDRLETLNQRLAAVDALTAQVGELRERVNVLAEQPSDTGADVTDAADPAPGPDAAALAHQLAHLAERLTATDTAARHTGEQVAAIDQRLSSISTELANQISELGRDIDALADRPAGDGGSATVSDEVLDALRAGQVKLANEQARYEIAFRNDLAALAEQVRQAGRR